MTDNKERKIILRNLLIYLAVTFGISWALFFAFVVSGRSLDFAEGAGAADIATTLGMLCPAIGVIITRFITKEGYTLTGEGSMMLGIDLKNRKYIFYIIAILLPWIYSEAGNLLKIIIQPACFDREFFRLAVPDARTAYIYPLMGIVSGVFFSIGGLGEETGWRGYMMPRMIKLFGTAKAVIIGGIIWGIWHWPLTYAGHNFGTDYKGYPFTGFAAMALMCVVDGILLTFLTVKTGSVWPAAIMHAVNNTMPSALQFFINPEKVTGIRTDSVVSFLVHFTPAAVIALAVLAVWLKSERKAKTLKKI